MSEATPRAVLSADRVCVCSRRPTPTVLSAGAVQTDPYAPRKVDDVRSIWERRRLDQRTDRSAVRHGGRVIGRDDETTGTIAMNGGEHASSMGARSDEPARG